MLKNKGVEKKKCHANTKHKKTSVAMLNSNKIHFKKIQIDKAKEKHFIIIKVI